MQLTVAVFVVQLDEDIWFTRPLTPKIVDAAAKNVRHFCRLRCVLVEKLLAGIGLYAGIDCYVGSFRDLSDEEYEKYDNQKVKHCHQLWVSHLPCWGKSLPPVLEESLW